MRITVTLDDDVVALIKQVRNERNASMKDVVNDGLRQSLSQKLTSPNERTPFQTRTFDAGRCLIGNVDNVAEALAIGEGEGFRCAGQYLNCG